MTDYKQAVSKLRTHLKEYVSKAGLKSLVLGISGGIDSALTIALAKPVCDELNIPLISRSITIKTNKPEEILRAKNCGLAYSHDFKEIDLSETFDFMLNSITEDSETVDKNSFDYKIRVGNVKARTRMVYLYDLAGKNKGMVLSTDNYTELLLGFWTLHGDVGDYGMIQNLWKTEVYEMSKYLVKNAENKAQADALQSCIDATPTDGLGITNSDLDQIGAKSYDEVDQILIDMLKNGKNSQFSDHKVVQRYRNSMFKRENPYNIPRDLITDSSYF